MATMICKNCGRELDESKFKMTRWGTRASVCTECAVEKRKESEKKTTETKLSEMEKEVQNARHLRIHEFTPRELMEELARRGYTGKLEYTVTNVIDITNF